MTDSRLKSITETAINIVIGYTINYTANAFILPHYGIPFNFWVYHEIGIIYTFVSIARQYGFRRLFERFGENENAYTLLVRLYHRISGD